MQTQLLSAIAGVTVYTTEALAKTGAVDSGAAFNTWMRAQTSTAANPITLTYDGWIYVANMAADFLQTTPTASGFITHKPLDGITTNGAGAVWAAKTTATSCMRNGAAAITISASNISDVTFTTNAQSTGLTFDFNYAQGGSQPHDDATNGWAMGAQFAGINRVTLNGATFENARTFQTYFVGCDGVTGTSSTVSVQNTRTDFNTDGFHVNGPCNDIFLSACTAANIGDDSIAINADEPILDSSVVNYNKGLLANWNGGTISGVQILNCVLTNSSAGVRLLALLSTHTLEKIVIDGLTGTIGRTSGTAIQNWYILNADNYDEVPYYLGGEAINRIGSLIVRNVNVQVASTHNTYKPSRFYFHCDLDSPLVDLTTITPVSADGATTVPLVQFAPTMPLPRAMVWGPTASAVVQDEFQRPNSATVGNGWNDINGSSWSISSNTATGAGNAATNGLLQTGSTGVNGMAMAVAITASSTGIFDVAVFRHTGSGTEYEAAFVAGTGANASLTLYKIIATAATSLLSATINAQPVVGDKVNVIGISVASILLVGVWDITQGRWISALTSVVDSSITTAGSFGMAYNATGTAGTFNYGSVTLFPAAATLSSLTVTQSGTDQFGNILLGATGNGTSYAGGGTWTTSAGSIDQFGRLRGLSQGQTANVTYTIGAVASTPLAVLGVGTGVGGGVRLRTRSLP